MNKAFESNWMTILLQNLPDTGVVCQVMKDEEEENKLIVVDQMTERLEFNQSIESGRNEEKNYTIIDGKLSLTKQQANDLKRQLMPKTNKIKAVVSKLENSQSQAVLNISSFRSPKSSIIVNKLKSPRQSISKNKKKVVEQKALNIDITSLKNLEKEEKSKEVVQNYEPVRTGNDR